MTESTHEEKRSIAQIGRMVRSIVEVETLDKFYWVGGKIERYHKSGLGHIYFELVDGNHRMHCMLPERQSNHVEFDLKNGMEIEVYADIQVYQNNVQVQLIVQKVKLTDSNGLSIISALNQLGADGLYPKTPKLPPEKVNKVGIITSYGSRAIGDFENTYQLLGQKHVLAPVIWEYVKLEGDQAQASILAGIEKLNQNPDVNVIAIIRGGGRYENLIVFDDLEIARKIATLDKFIITGIGHHKDSTLADEVSDHVASTPTAVAHYIATMIINNSPIQSTVTSSDSRITNVLLGIVGLMFIAIAVLLILNFS